MFVDYVLNGEGHGEIGEGLSGVRFDIGWKRPYLDSRGRRCVTVNTGRKRFNPKTGLVEPVYEKREIDNSPTLNATTLRQNDWIEMDRVVQTVKRTRLRAWTDLASAASYGGFNGMAKLTLETEAMNDPGEAVVDMDGLSPGRADTPLFKLFSLPLPITHSDSYFSARQLAVSRNSGTPLDTTMIEASTRRCAEKVEDTLIGIETGITFGGRTTGPFPQTGSSKVYGYTNFPYRQTKTDLTTPTGSNPEAINTDIIEMIEMLQTAGFYGPYMVYHSTPYSQFLNADYFRTGGTSAVTTVRQRIMQNEGIMGIRRLDRLTSGYQLIVMQMDSQVARAINALDFSVVQWEERGGMQLKFMVMCIMVAQLRVDYNGNCGIVHGTTS